MQFLAIIGMAVGWGVLRNYHAHAKEMGSEPSTIPHFPHAPASLVSFEDGVGEINHPDLKSIIHHEVEKAQLVKMVSLMLYVLAWINESN